MTLLHRVRSTALVLVCLGASGGCQDAQLPAQPTSAMQETARTVKPRSRAASGVIHETTFDDVKFEMKKEERFERRMLTPEIEQLDGQRIRIRGYILPTFRQTGLTEFVLVRDNMECCFGPGAALYDAILVQMNAGVSTDFSIRPVAVEGVFSVRELIGPDGKHLAVYHLQGEAVK